MSDLTEQLRSFGVAIAASANGIKVAHRAADEIDRLVKQRDEVIGCFNAAIAEGLIERLAESPFEPGSLRDLVERRLLHAYSSPADMKQEAPATQRRYSLLEIDRMRAALRFKEPILFMTATMSGYADDARPVQEREEMLRSYMSAGVDPDELIAHFNKAPAQENTYGSAQT